MSADKHLFECAHVSKHADSHTHTHTRTHTHPSALLIKLVSNYRLYSAICLIGKIMILLINWGRV